MASHNNPIKITNPRVRFAPSPTGELHIGSARTALFNYLFARRYGGTCILRIEDTDMARSTEESLRNLVDGLNWLGIHWDEGADEENPLEVSAARGDHGPYLQSARREGHLAAAKKLLELGYAYECICPPLETTGTGKCGCYDRQDELKDIPEDKKSLKFRILPGPPVVVRDIIRGEVMFRRDDMQDFVIVRPGGLPTYNFVVVIDDSAMEISHVIRGEDHLSNTPKQILIYEALDLKVPEFAHIPLIHGSDGSKMSKRHGAVTVQAYKDEGFLPGAFVNYLARLGWNDDTDREIYSLTELEQLFSLEQVSSSPACFDRDKLLWFNGKYIRELTDEELLGIGLPFLGKYVNPDDLNDSTAEWLFGLVSLYKDRVEVLNQLEEVLSPYFTDPKTYSEESLRTAKVTGDAFMALLELKKRFQAVDWTKELIEETVRTYVKEKGIKFKLIAQPLRLVITGSLASPGIFETLYYVGKEPTLRRLENFLANYQAPD